VRSRGPVSVASSHSTENVELAAPMSTAERKLWGTMCDVLPAERNCAKSKAKRKALFASLDGDGSGDLSVKELMQALNGPLVGLSAMTQTIGALHGTQAISLEPIVAGAVALASQVHSPGGDGLSQTSQELTGIRYAQFRLFLVYLRHHIELYTMFEDLEHQCHHEHDEPLSLADFQHLLPQFETWHIHVDDPVAEFAHIERLGGGGKGAGISFSAFLKWALEKKVHMEIDGVETAEEWDELERAQM